ncbi:MAG: tRNA (adenosine(37)-N6)-dimethylallyltransferase MiaA [Inquilinus sp.]|nr:tRNA (adenosine(37)-N6)-dimethylallyltransferase MiaA [Inquilinus sp.]
MAKDNTEDRRVIVVGGPTASGKSALALGLAEALDGVVINADSMQVYRDLSVLTARPGPADLARATHRLYGVLDGAERCSAARWRGLAEAEIAKAHAAGRLPIVCGGTGLYLRALMEGLAEIPPMPEPVRAEAMALHARLGGAAFHDRLAARDPAMAARLHPGDTQRLIRAWEVLAATGRSLADWQQGTAPGPAAGWRVGTIVLIPPRDALYAACDARFRRMVENGGIEEVRALLDRHLDPGLPVMKALGVREIGNFLSGEIPLETAIARAQQATRNYAKRQLTWFRNQMAGKSGGDRHVIDAQYSEKFSSETLSIIREWR